jgi:hypothetical protein
MSRLKLRPLPTQAYLREWFDYEPVTGAFRWKKRAGSRGPMGAVAGHVDPHGYIIIGVPGFGRYRAHRLAWVYVHGPIPEDAEPDHIDRNSSNNAIDNLRLATFQQQNRNIGLRSDNRSGFKGVHFHPSQRGPKKWRAQITIDGRHICLGHFRNPDDAHSAYVQAAIRHFDEFACFS